MACSHHQHRAGCPHCHRHLLTQVGTSDHFVVRSNSSQDARNVSVTDEQAFAAATIDHAGRTNWNYVNTAAAVDDIFRARNGSDHFDTDSYPYEIEINLSEDEHDAHRGDVEPHRRRTEAHDYRQQQNWETPFEGRPSWPSDPAGQHLPANASQLATPPSSSYQQRHRPSDYNGAYSAQQVARRVDDGQSRPSHAPDGRNERNVRRISSRSDNWSYRADYDSDDTMSAHSRPQDDTNRRQNHRVRRQH